MTQHALERWDERFSGQDIDQELESATRATSSQKKSIKIMSPTSYDKEAEYMVSIGGVIFVIKDDNVLTVMPLVTCNNKVKRNKRTVRNSKYM